PLNRPAAGTLLVEGDDPALVRIGRDLTSRVLRIERYGRDIQPTEPSEALPCTQFASRSRPSSITVVPFGTVATMLGVRNGPLRIRNREVATTASGCCAWAAPINVKALNTTIARRLKTFRIK